MNGQNSRQLLRYLPLVVAALFFICFPHPVAALPVAPVVNDSTKNTNHFHEAVLQTPVDSILVVKRYRHMYVFNSGKLLKVYNISLGQEPVGAKHFKGDLKTPEGIYHITNKNAFSVAHKSLAISYPNNTDRKYAKRFGQPTGGDVMIHGSMNGDEDKEDQFAGKSDWTWGCIAVRNVEIDELFEYVKLGAVINIVP